MQEKTELKLKNKLKNCKMTLTEKQQKHYLYHLEKLIKVNFLQVKKYYLLIKEEWQKKTLQVAILQILL